MRTATFSPEKARRIAAVVDRIDLAGGDLLARRQQIDDYWVYVTSSTPIGGFYPGVRLTFNQITDEWDDNDVVWIKVANGRTPVAGQRYRGRRHGLRGGKVCYSIRVESDADGCCSTTVITGTGVDEEYRSSLGAGGRIVPFFEEGDDEVTTLEVPCEAWIQYEALDIDGDSGYRPAWWLDVDVETQTFSVAGECWARPVNRTTPEVNRKYAGKYHGFYEGRPVFFLADACCEQSEEEGELIADFIWEPEISSMLLRESEVATSETTTLTIDMPLSIDGGAIVAIIATTANGTLPTGTGWTLLTSATQPGDDGLLIAVLTRTAGGSEPGTYSFTVGEGGIAVGQILSFANYTTPFAWVQTATESGGGTALTVPGGGLTNGDIDTQVYTVWVNSGGQTMTVPDGMSELQSTVAGGLLGFLTGTAPVAPGDAFIDRTATAAITSIPWAAVGFSFGYTTGTYDYPYIASTATSAYDFAESVEVDLPSHTDGDLLVAVIVQNGAGWGFPVGISGGGGWGYISSPHYGQASDSPPCLVHILGKVASSEGPTATFSAGSGTSRDFFVIVFAVRGHDSTRSGERIGSSYGSGPSASLLAEDVNPTEPTSGVNTLDFVCWVTNTDEDLTPPAGMSTLFNGLIIGTLRLLVATAQIPDGGTFDDRTATATGAVNWAAFGCGIEKNT